MSFPPRHFFSLSSSSRHAGRESNPPSSAGAVTKTTAGTGKFLQPSSLELPVRAASGGVDNERRINNDNIGTVYDAFPTSRITTFEKTVHNRNPLTVNDLASSTDAGGRNRHLAFLQSVAASRHGQAQRHHQAGAVFSEPSMPILPSPSSSLQFGPGVAPAFAAAAPQQAESPGLAQAATMLVASLQTQQQAQVQAALARAYGPRANIIGGLDATAVGNASFGPAGVRAPGAGGTNFVGGLWGQSQSVNAMAAVQAQQTTRDALTRMQLAQLARQQHQPQLQQEKQQHQAANNSTHNHIATALSFDPTKCALDQTYLIRLQLEHESHSRMVQMAQTNRQERAIIAAQESMVKKQQMELKKNGSTEGRKGDSIADRQERPSIANQETMMKPPCKDLKEADHAPSNGSGAVGSAGENESAAANFTQEASMNDTVKDAAKTVVLHNHNHQPSNADAAILTVTAAGFPHDDSSLLTTNICQSIPKSTKGDADESYAKAKREHLVVIPRASAPKEGEECRSGCARVMCGAPDMPSEHNHKTVKFAIPPSIVHGDELLYSFPSGRNTGTKFRYCLHCRVPLMKCNHQHGHQHDGSMPGSLSEKGKRKEEDREGVSRVATPELPEMVECRKPSPEVALSSTPIPPSVPPSNATTPIKSSLAGDQVPANSSYDTAKVQRWAALLDDKPPAGDGRAMVDWMMSLMDQAEDAAATFPIKGDETMRETANSSGKVRALESDDNSDIVSGVSQPPKKKFKQDFEEV